MTFYSWIVWLHILTGVIFFFVHGVSMATAFFLKKETNPDKLKMLLELTGITIMPMGVCMLLMLGTSLYMGVSLSLWSSGWWGTSFLLFFAMIAWMTWYGRKFYSPIRKALGMEYMSGFSTHNPAGEPSSMDEVFGLIAKTNPHMITTVGFVVLAVLLWLMRAKPF